MTPRGSFLRVLAAGLLLALSLAVSLVPDAPAQAQNQTCPTAPPGDDSNKCASTEFVQNALSSFFTLVCSATPSACAFLTGYYNAAWYAKCDGTTDDHVALQAWLNAISGKTGYVPSVCVTGTSLTGLDNTTIIGGGQNVSTLKGIGTANPVLFFSNKSNIAISDLTLQGSDSVTSWASGPAGGVVINQDNGGNNYTFRNLTLKGFNATYWLYMDAGSTGGAFSNITFDNVYLATTAADVPTDPTSTNNANFGIRIASGSAGNGQVQNLNIRDLKVDGTALCIGAILYGNIAKFDIDNAQFLNVGATSTVAHCTNTLSATNSYALAIYDLYSDGHPPHDGIISNFYALNPYSAGIYITGDGDPTHTALSYNDANILISNPLITGQSANDEVVPRAALSINYNTNVFVTGAKLYNNHGGVAANGQLAGTVSISGIDCNTNFAAMSGKPSSCIQLQPGPITTTNLSAYVVKGSQLTNTGGTLSQVVRTSSGSGNYFGSVDFTNNKVSSSDIGANFAGVFLNKRLTIDTNHFSGVAATNMLDTSSISVGVVDLRNLIFDLSSGVLGYGVKLDSATIYASGLTFQNRNSGAFSYSAVGTVGTLSNVQFPNVATAQQVQPSSMGLVQPTWSGASQDFVQNLQAAPASGATTAGWLNSANGVHWGPLVALGTLGTGVGTALGNNLNASGGIISPTPTRAGDVPYWNGSAWVTLAGNNSGTNCFSEGSTGIPAWAACSGGGGGTPGGSNTQVQYNNAGSFGGITGATSNGTALTLVAPVLGTPASMTATNVTGLPISTGLTGAGTGVLTALGVNVGTAGAPVVNGGALGTPSSGTGTNLTGIPTTGLTGTLQAAQEPAHTGGCTNSAGSLALSCQINTNFPMGNAGNCGAIAANQTVFFGPNGCYNVSEVQVQSPVSAPFTLKNFYASSFQAPGGSQSYILTVRKNAVSTSITCTISAAATTCNDTTHTASFAAADLIDVQIVLSVSAAVAQPMTMATAVTTSP